jgi:hypothetical protein
MMSTITSTNPDIAIFISCGSTLTSTQVPIGAAMNVARPRGSAKDDSETFIAVGRSCSVDGSPETLASGRATKGPKKMLNTGIDTNAPPNPTNPRMKPAAAIVKVRTTMGNTRDRSNLGL